MVTIKEVARYCNVSVATVSRVINNDKNVKEETKQLVLQGIKELNYVPNIVGRNLRTYKSNTVLVLLAGISNQFFSKVIVGMERRAEEDNYKVVIGLTHKNQRIEKNFFENLKMHVYDGLILFDPCLTSDYYNESAKSLPILFCCEQTEKSNLAYIGIDNKKAGFDITDYYLKKGFKNIGFVGSEIKYSSAIEREEGYLKAIKERGHKPDKNLIYYGDYSYESGIEAAKYFLSLKRRPEAIFAISDLMAIGIINELIKNNIKVGKDIFVCGFDNTKITQMFNPKITTVSQPRFEIGYTAMDTLLNFIKADKKMQTTKLEHKLIIRES